MLFIRDIPPGNSGGRIPRTLSVCLAPGDGLKDKERIGTRTFRQHDIRVESLSPLGREGDFAIDVVRQTC